MNEDIKTFTVEEVFDEPERAAYAAGERAGYERALDDLREKGRQWDVLATNALDEGERDAAASATATALEFWHCANALESPFDYVARLKAKSDPEALLDRASGLVSEANKIRNEAP